MYRLKPLLTDLKLVMNYSNSPHHDNSYRGTNNVIYSGKIDGNDKKNFRASLQNLKVFLNFTLLLAPRSIINMNK